MRDHLGIVAGIIDDIGMVDKINDLLGTDPREKVNAGEVVKAIILNGLGFVSKPLYLFSKFFEDNSIEHLLGNGIKSEDLNDDKLGRVMDKVYKYGLTELFLIIALEVIKKFGILTNYSHLDSTSLHLHGEYNKVVAQLLGLIWFCEEQIWLEGKLAYPQLSLKVNLKVFNHGLKKNIRLTQVNHGLRSYFSILWMNMKL